MLTTKHTDPPAAWVRTALLAMVVTVASVETLAAATPALAVVEGAGRHDLSPDALSLLAGSLEDAGDAQPGVEQRTSFGYRERPLRTKSAVVDVLASVAGGGGPSAQDFAINTKGTGVSSGRLAGGEGSASGTQEAVTESRSIPENGRYSRKNGAIIFY